MRQRFTRGAGNALLLSLIVLAGAMVMIMFTPSAAYAYAHLITPPPIIQLPTIDTQGILQVAWDWLTITALMLWLGILVSERVVIARMEQGAALLAATERQSYSLQWLSLLALLIGECVSFTLRLLHYLAVTNTPFTSDIPGQFISTTFYGQLWSVRAILLLAALALLYWTGRPRPQPKVEQREQRHITREQSTPAVRRIVSHAVTTPISQPRITRDFTLSYTTGTPTGPLKPAQTASAAPVVPVTKRTLNLLWFIVITALLLSLALDNDIVAVAPLHISAVIMFWLYLAALGTWFGGLSYTSFILLPVVRRENLTDTLVAFLRRFSNFVLTAIVVALITGIFFSEATLPHIQQLLTTSYGRVLLVTIILSTLLALSSLYLLFIFRTRLARQALLLPVVGAELPARRSRLSALEQTQAHLKRSINFLLIGIIIVLLCLALMAFYMPPMLLSPLP
jgi:putative copper export protein